jgi:uncharacterized repeat protein (TIGR01451 family)
MTSEPPRSRQELVIPPRGSHLPVVLGAVASAGIGFALVWAVGLGRTVPPSPGTDGGAAANAAADAAPITTDPPVATTGPEHDPVDVGRPWPARIDPAWGGRPSAAVNSDPAVQPTSYAEPGRFEPVDDATQPLSRFSHRPVAPAAAAEPTAEAVDDPAVEQGDTQTDVGDSLRSPIDRSPQAVEPPSQPDDASPSAFDRRLAPDDQPAALENQPSGLQESPATSAGTGPAPLSVAGLTGPDADGAIGTEAGQVAAPTAAANPFLAAGDELAGAAVAASTDASIVDGTESVDPTDAPAPSMPPPAAPPAVPTPVSSPVPAAGDEAPASRDAVADAATPDAASVDAEESNTLPSAEARLSAAPPAARFAGSGPAAFAAAPPLVPDAPPAMPTSGPFAGPAPATGQLTTGPDTAATVVSADATKGQGRPGPPQLEGLQSPHIALEKRGPREIQVGKPARYEILVRNVGSAVAHDVTVSDAVPYGATLVTTTPPASPGATPDGLVWRLGTMPPGGQGRLVVELMPQIEGEIGSVASVAFRADATARSRATKPALALDCTQPEAVRIGRDALVTITVSNPGSGTATGVVVEGSLPETVSHRSGRELEFDVGQLRPGESRSIELVLGTTGPGVKAARLIARADGGIEVERSVSLEVTAPALELAIDMPTRRFLQRPATCAISMVNAGTATARSVELAAQLPPGMKFVRANNAGWHDSRTNRVLWSLEELPPGETGTVELVVMPVDLGGQKVMAAARSADGPADQVTHVCEVEGVAALVFEVTDSEDPIEIDGITEYVVRVGNHGTKAATDVRLAASLLGNLEPVEAQGPAGHRIENLGIFFEPLASLAPAEEAVFRIRVRGRAAGNQRVQVQLMSADQSAPITKEEITRVYDDR